MPDKNVSLRNVADVLGVAPPGREPLILDVHHDSRRTTPRSLFVAIRGERDDGHDFVGDAVGRGAVAVIAEHQMDIEVPYLLVPDARRALAVAAAVVHRHPSRAMAVVGITGTNGKTTVAHMIEAIGTSAGLKTAAVGTLGARVDDAQIPLQRTTPESSDLQRILREMADAQVDVVALEVSSHALSLHRVDEIDFRVAVFTNLSQDHLDFHGDMDSYFAAKQRLFEAGRAQVGVVNVDDRWGRELVARSGVRITRVGGEHGNELVVAGGPDHGRSGSLSIRWTGQEAEIQLGLPGRFNIANAAVAAAACLEIGVGLADVQAGLESLQRVPGRFELVAGSWSFHVIVDYAHTPAAVARVIAAAREISSGRVIALLGAGGNRDADKRPMMGAAVSRADVAIVTSDNPRSEDPVAIMNAVEFGVAGPAEVIIEVDRRAAIRAALAIAGDRDIVLVLGKGHEQGQEFDHGRVEPFDDRRVVAEEWDRLLAEVAP
jgi:UDP-N-acetylmuramoyl-L-alanyl-D-glutamate--2,6-diaminopimelate ligase